MLNKKTILCSYYINNKCKFMNSPDLCLFAHGDEELSLCKYNINCKYIDTCKYKHTKKTPKDFKKYLIDGNINPDLKHGDKYLGIYGGIHSYKGDCIICLKSGIKTEIKSNSLCNSCQKYSMTITGNRFGILSDVTQNDNTQDIIEKLYNILISYELNNPIKLECFLNKIFSSKKKSSLPHKVTLNNAFYNKYFNEIIKNKQIYTINKNINITNNTYLRFNCFYSYIFDIPKKRFEDIKKQNKSFGNTILYTNNDKIKLDLDNSINEECNRLINIKDKIDYCLNKLIKKTKINIFVLKFIKLLKINHHKNKTLKYKIKSIKKNVEKIKNMNYIDINNINIIEKEIIDYNNNEINKIHNFINFGKFFIENNIKYKKDLIKKAPNILNVVDDGREHRFIRKCIKLYRLKEHINDNNYIISSIRFIRDISNDDFELFLGLIKNENL